MMDTPGGLPFLSLGCVLLFTCLFGRAPLVKGSTFCSVSVEDTHLKCTNASVIFIHKILSNEINDHYPHCLKQLKMMCNMQKSCTLPSLCKQLPKSTYIAYGCIPEPQKKIQCSNTQVPVVITDRAFLISPTYPRLLPIWGEHCLWRIKTSVNGTISIYVLDLMGNPDLIIHSYPVSSVAGRRILTTAININISSHLTLDLSLQPFSNVWLSIELGKVTNKNASLSDHFFCRPPPNPNDQFRSLCGGCLSNLAGTRIALIVLTCIILILIASLVITIHCYCKKYRTFEARTRPIEQNRVRQTSAVTPYHTTVVQPLMSGGHMNGMSDTDKFKKPFKEHTYDHLNNYPGVNYNLTNPHIVKIDSQKPKPFQKRTCDDEDSDSTYATVGENT